MEELLSLKWNNHRTSFLHLLSMLRKKSTYTDVTLACDGKLYNVHKMILSACSDYFSQIFDNIACPNPVIVLKDMSSSNLESLLDYMYLGEVNVRQANLASLIQAAECLKLKGLAVPDNDKPEMSHSKKRSADSSPSVRRKSRRSTHKDTTARENTFEGTASSSTPSTLKMEDVITIKEESCVDKEEYTDNQHEYGGDWDSALDPDGDTNQFHADELPNEDMNPFSNMASPFQTDTFTENENIDAEPNFDQPPPPSRSSSNETLTTVRPNQKNACSYCNKLFYDASTLKRHTRIHTGEKPFACSFCPFRSGRKECLLYHSAVYHEKLE